MLFAQQAFMKISKLNENIKVERKKIHCVICSINFYMEKLKLHSLHCLHSVDSILLQGRPIM